MGYPKIPGFNCFQTAEEAVISAVPEKRFTVTEGQVAAEAQQIWSRDKFFLITAKNKSIKNKKAILVFIENESLLPYTNTVGLFKQDLLIRTTDRHAKKI